MKYRIDPYRREHLALLKVGPKTKDLIDFIGLETFSNSLQTNGPAYSGFADDELIVMGGVNILWPGVSEAWAMLGASYQKHGRFIHKNTVRYLQSIAKAVRLQRVQAVVLKGHYAGVEWVNRLGFKYEGEMVAYFHGKTYLRYAKIFEVQ